MRQIIVGAFISLDGVMQAPWWTRRGHHGRFSVWWLDRALLG